MTQNHQILVGQGKWHIMCVTLVYTSSVSLRHVTDFNCINLSADEDSNRIREFVQRL